MKDILEINSKTLQIIDLLKNMSITEIDIKEQNSFHSIIIVKFKHTSKELKISLSEFPDKTYICMCFGKHTWRETIKQSESILDKVKSIKYDSIRNNI